MSKVRNLLEAHNEVAEHGRDSFLCLTCDNPKAEGETYCLYCKSYWDDVSKGLFDD
jgi:hypothetical protein